MKSKHLTAIFCLILIVCLPISYAQDTSTPNLSPLLEIDLPEYYDQSRIDIAGRTEIGADVTLYVNNNLARHVICDDVLCPGGYFTFNSVALNPDSSNTVRIDAVKGASTNSKAFIINVDLVPPVLTLDQPIPSALGTNDYSLNGTIDEPVNFTIIINNNTDFHQEDTTSFSHVINLDEGPNLLKLIAVDNAGNSVDDEYNINADTQPPELLNVQPLEASPFYYQGRAITDITGTSEPGAEVFIYITPAFWTSASLPVPDDDEIIGGAQFHHHVAPDGGFRFTDVDFENPGPALRVPVSGQVAFFLTGSTDTNIIPPIPTSLPTPQQVPPSQLGLSNQLQTDEKTVNVYVLAVDKVGLSVKQAYTITIGSCFSGDFDFSFNSLPQYQTPTLLSPDRLDEGTEVISFVLGMEYRGPAAVSKLNSTTPVTDNYWEITGVSIDRACRSDLFMNRDPSYNISCQIMGTRPQIEQPINSEQTHWYFRYNLGQTSQFTTSDPNVWEALNNHQMKFPLKITVTYNEKLPGQPLEQKAQSICREVNYYVDIPIEPDKVLPDWMIAQGQRDINATITNIENAIELLDKVIRPLSMVCLGGILLRFVIQTYRRITEAWAIASCLAEKKGDCKIRDKATLEKCYYIKTGKKAPFPDTAHLESLNNCEKFGQPMDISQSKDSAFFTTVEGAWTAEENLYIVYRFICDRIFCHAAPAKWTQEKTVAEIKQAKYAERGCSTDASVARYFKKEENCFDEQKGNFLREINNRHEIPQNTCYILGNEIYIDSKTKQGSFDLLKRVDDKASPSEPLLKAVKESGRYYTYQETTCQKACEKDGGQWESQCFEPGKQPKTGGAFGTSAGQKSEWYPYGPTKDCWLGNIPKDCYCKKSEEKEWNQTRQTYKTWIAGLEKGTASGKDAATETPGSWPWSYRQWQIYRTSSGSRGVYYPEERYYSDRDASAAFGLDYLPDYIFGEHTTEVNPFTQHIGALQTVCLTGIRQRLLMVKNIAMGMNNCLEQIKTSGKADSGVCKELFTQLICNNIYKVFTLFQNRCTPTNQQEASKEARSPNLFTILTEGASAVGNTMDDMSAELTEDYGNANMNNYFEGGTQALTKKICLAAFGYDVDFNVNDFVDASYSVPFRTSASVFSSMGPRGKREYMGFDPTTGQSMYDYRFAWTIYPGCNLQSYKVDLVAVTEADQRKYNLDCSAVNNHEPDTTGCDNIQGSSEQKRAFYTGGPVAQGAYIDENKGEIISSIYRYDHVKITLNLAPEWDAEKCFPADNREGDQGIFYFPIYDSTTSDITQCSVSGTDGKFFCSIPGLAGMGNAWIERVQCRDPVTFDWKDCETIDYSATPDNQSAPDKILVRTDVFNSGQKQCLKGYVQTTYAGQRPEFNQWWTVIGIGQPRSIPIEMELIPAIDDNLFSGTARYSLTPPNSMTITVTQYPDPPTVPISPFEIYFATNDSSKAGTMVGTTPSLYQVKLGTAPLGTWNDFISNQEISDPSGKFKFRINTVNLLYSTNQTNGYYTAKSTISYLHTLPSADQTWTIYLELYNPDTNGVCTSGGATKVTSPPGLAFKPDRIIPIKVKKIRFTSAEIAAYSQAKQAYSQGNYAQAASRYLEVITLARPTLTNALAYYWYVISKIRDGASKGNPWLYKTDIKTQIGFFKLREAAYNAVNQSITASDEYQIIKPYLLEIESKIPQ